MATLDDLFGGPKRSPQPKWNSVGDVHVGVITEEPSQVQEKDFQTKDLKWWNKEGRIETGSKSEAEDKGWHPVMQIVVPVKLNTGEDATFYFAGPKKTALKNAMQETQLPLTIGTTVGIKFAAEEKGRGGFPKRVWAVKLAKAE